MSCGFGSDSQGLNPLNQVYRLNHNSQIEQDMLQKVTSLNPLNQVYRLNQKYKRDFSSRLFKVLIP